MRSNSTPPKSAMRQTSQTSSDRDSTGSRGKQSRPGSPTPSEDSSTQRGRDDDTASRLSSRSVSFTTENEHQSFFKSLPSRFVRHSVTDSISTDESKLISLATVDQRPKLDGKQLAWPNGQIYSGPMKNGRPHGDGTLLMTDGQRMDTKWKNGQFIGFSDGHIDPEAAKTIAPLPEGYSGSKTRDITARLLRAFTVDFTKQKYDKLLSLATQEGTLKQYKNVIVWPNGQTYTGELKNGRPHGEGVVVLPGGFILPSRWKNGRWQESFVEDPDKAIRQSVRDYPQETEKVEAFFSSEDLMRASQGLMSNFEIRTTMWAHKFDTMVGFGTEIKLGEDDYLVVRGKGDTLAWPSGQVYVGGFKGGRPHGFGTVLLKDGRRIQTQWHEGACQTGVADPDTKALLSLVEPLPAGFKGLPPSSALARPRAKPQEASNWLTTFFASKKDTNG